MIAPSPPSRTHVGSARPVAPPAGRQSQGRRVEGASHSYFYCSRSADTDDDEEDQQQHADEEGGEEDRPGNEQPTAQKHRIDEIVEALHDPPGNTKRV